MLFIWDTIHSGRGASRGGGGSTWECFYWLLPDGTEAWEFKEDVPMIIRERVTPTP